MKFDLLTLVETGGCSIKLPASKLQDALKGLPKFKDKKLLVDIDTHDDAGVYQLTDDIALIQTTDFFTPICSDPYEFGQIAAANSLSDVYAMGGAPVTALNLVMFPPDIPLEALNEIMKGGIDKVKEAGALIVGGHTISDSPPKYGLAVTGIVHPERIITNASAKPGEKLILTKPIGMGVIVAGKKMNKVDKKNYQAVLDNMKQLNKAGAEVMQKFNVKCATDITGFGLMGHAIKMAQASNVTIKLQSTRIPLFEKAYDLVALGCIPSCCFKNQDFIESDCLISETVDYNLKMLMLDAQTSGGLLMSAPEDRANTVTDELKESGYPKTKIIGEVLPKTKFPLQIN